MRSGGSAEIVLSTAASVKQAEPIARALVEERLAACVNIVGPVRSIYRWQGRIERDREVMMIIKTRSALLERLERRVRELHPYEVPELLVLGVASGAAPYLDWLLAATGSRSVGGGVKR
jgi:periplasmic divalent cation tolerance protein